jgi:3-oxoacyl-[acyl-carrier protein] reductase
MNFKNKVALITGSTSGIGKEIAKQLLESGAKVVINYSGNEEKARETKEDFRDYENNILIIKADVSDENQVQEMFKQVEEKFGALEYLVNNAGIDFMESIEDFNIDNFRREVDVNFIGRFICIQKAIPLLKKSITPRIINIASRLGTRPMDLSSPYCTCEAATIMLTQVSALELSKYNIKVNTVSPSMTLTPLALKSYTEEEIKEMASKNPSKRLGKPEDIANTVLFLLSDKAEYINGENINVNGGILLL